MAGRWRQDNPFEEGEIEVNPFSVRYLMICLSSDALPIL